MFSLRVSAAKGACFPRNFAWLVTGLIFTGFLLPYAAASCKQQTPPAPAPPAPISSPLFDELDDIDHLNVLVPLKFTPEQLDKMIDAVFTTQADYTKKLNTLTATFLEKTTAEIHATKKAALAGTAIAPDFIEKVNALLKQRDALQQEHLRALCEALRGIVTDQQQTQAAALARDVVKKMGRTTKGSDPQWFNYYVLNAIMNYPRIVSVLKEMRGATSENSGNGQSASGNN